MKEPHLLIHNIDDNVGVVAIEGLTNGTEMLCVCTQDDSDMKISVFQDIPIGHKVALKDMNVGDTVVKYGEDIGKIVQDVKKGYHVHVHNLKTKRW